MIAKGSFEVSMSGDPPYEVVGGVGLSRASLDKRFSGSLEATSKGQMLAARTPVEGSAVYVALERITGTLEGKRGTFAVAHMGVMARGTPSLTIAIVPDSGTGELSGISGRMEIEIIDGRHLYEIHYALVT